MACCLDVTLLDSETIKEIYNSLHIVPTQEVRRGGRSSKGSIPFYAFRQYKDEQGRDMIVLPFTFGRCIIQRPVNTDVPHMTVDLQFKGELWPQQVPYVNQAIDHLNKYNTANLNLSTGAGKTTIGIYLACKTSMLTAVIMTNSKLLPQWKKEFEEKSNASCWIVGDKDPPPFPTVVICLDTRWDKIPEAMRQAIGTLIIDEAHLFPTASRIDCLLAFTPYYVIQETATWHRDNGCMSLMECIGGSHLIAAPLKKEFVVKVVSTGIQPVIEKDSNGITKWSVYEQSLLYHDRRNSKIVELVKAYSHMKILCVGSEVEHCKLLYQLLNDAGESVDYMAGKKKDYVDSRVLIGIDQSVGVGFDEKSFCKTWGGRRFNMVIQLMSCRSQNNITQIIGRVMRTDETPLVIYLVDDHKISKDHWSVCYREVFKHLNCTVHKEPMDVAIKSALEDMKKEEEEDTDD